jgi:hypothetical protein
MELDNIPFNKPYLSGKESEYIINAVQSGFLQLYIVNTKTLKIINCMYNINKVSC